MEHLMGCHGEWMMLAHMVQTLPFVGSMIQPFLGSIMALVPTHRHNR